jgi:long-chain acyl-CoA synthetase
MAAGWLAERLASFGAQPAIRTGSETVSYKALADAVAGWLDRRVGAPAGEVVLLSGDASPGFLALLLALLQRGDIAVPMAPVEAVRIETCAAIVQAQLILRFAADGSWSETPGPGSGHHPLCEKLRAAHHAGLVVFTSGSTGEPKASLHQADRFLEKYRRPRPALRTIMAPPVDHMAGLDTLFYTLTSGGLLILPPHRTPDSIAETIAHHQVELLPATPTFLRLLLMEAADLSSLRMITYGSEVMPDTTLAALRARLPACRLLQKYGTTEFGSPRTRSREDGSLWFRIEQDDFATRVVDGRLWVRTAQSMLGYLNAPPPVEEDGWTCTGDRVEVEGDYIRVLGRDSDLINVGGHKVYPAEVENVLLALPNIRDAVVTGETHPLMGQVVSARLLLQEPEEAGTLRHRIRAACAQQLPAYAVPVHIRTVDETLWNHRFKKSRIAGT